jgi:glycosyltransferase involved in cell wall biosynthesis
MSAAKIGLLCGDLDAARDGVAGYAGRLAAHLAAIGFEPLLLTTYQLADAAAGDAVGVTDGWGSAGIAAAVRAIRRLSLDVLHVQFAPSAYRFSRSVGLVPLMIGRRLPLVVTLHEYGVWAERQPVRRMLVGPLWSMAERRGWLDRETWLLTVRGDRVVVTNSGHAAVLVRRLPGRRAAVTEVPIGSNIEVAPVDRAEVRRAVRRQLGADGEAPLVVFFGFLHPVKGLERLIDAAAELRGAHPTLRLVLAGGDESHSVSGAEARALRRTLQDAAARRGMGEHLVITGYLPGAQVSHLLQAADVAVFPFDHGVIMDKSGAVLAALSHGVPTIATPSKVDQSPTGGDPAVLWVWPPDGPALADAIDRVLTEPTLADRLRRAGSAEVEDHQWPQIAARHARLYHDVVEQAAARTRPWPGTAASTSVGRPRPTRTVAVADDNETTAGPAPGPPSCGYSRPGRPSPGPTGSASGAG